MDRKADELGLPLAQFPWGLPWWLRRSSICVQFWRPGFDPWVGKIPWRRKWHPTPVLLPGKSLGWRNLVGYSAWGRKESDTTEWLHFHFYHTNPSLHNLFKGILIFCASLDMDLQTWSICCDISFGILLSISIWLNSYWLLIFWLLVFDFVRFFLTLMLVNWLLWELLGLIGVFVSWLLCDL